jgi:hypothetical protein
VETLSEHKRGIILAVCLALILVASLAGASYYLLPPSPVPTPAPAPATTPTPIPTPIPIPTPDVRVHREVVSTQGFGYTDMGDTFPEKVLVLRQGTSANITVRVYSLHNESRRVSLTLDLIGSEEGLETISYEFHPSTFELPPSGEAYSTLTLKAGSNAPNMLFFYPLVEIHVEGFQAVPGYGVGESLGYSILVFPYAPSYIFYIFAEETPATPQPPVYPPPYPTPAPTPPPSPPWEPLIEVEKGGEARILFCIATESVSPFLTLNLTYNSGQLPEGIKAEIVLDPIKAIQGPLIVKSSLLLTLEVDSKTPEGTYDITAKCNINQIICERVFHLKVMSP